MEHELIEGMVYVDNYNLATAPQEELDKPIYMSPMQKRIAAMENPERVTAKTMTTGKTTKTKTKTSRA